MRQWAFFIIMLATSFTLFSRAPRPSDVGDIAAVHQWRQNAYTIVDEIIDGTYNDDELPPLAEEGECDLFGGGEEDFCESVAMPKSAPVEQGDCITVRIECAQKTRSAQRAAVLLALCYERAYSHHAKPGSLIEMDEFDPYVVTVGPLVADGLRRVMNAECGRHTMVFNYKPDGWGAVDISIVDSKSSRALRVAPNNSTIRTYDLARGLLYDARLRDTWSARAYLFDPTVTKNLHLFVTRQWHAYQKKSAA